MKIVKILGGLGNQMFQRKIILGEKSHVIHSSGKQYSAESTLQS